MSLGFLFAFITATVVLCLWCVNVLFNLIFGQFDYLKSEDTKYIYFSPFFESSSKKMRDKKKRAKASIKRQVHL